MPSPPPSQQGDAEPQAGPQAGSQAGAQVGPQAGAGAAHGVAAGAPQDRNSMNDGLRQLLAPPKQLLQPGAAAKLRTAIARHIVRAMMRFSTAG